MTFFVSVAAASIAACLTETRPGTETVQIRKGAEGLKGMLLLPEQYNLDMHFTAVLHCRYQ